MQTTQSSSRGALPGLTTGTGGVFLLPGRNVDSPLIIVFQLEEERMVCEKTYFDIGTPLRQLGVARDPNSRSGKIATALNHPLVVARALIRSQYDR